MKRLLIGIVLIAYCLTAIALPCAFAEEAEPMTCGIYEINQFGNIILNIYAHMLDECGYEAGDIVLVTIGDQSWQMPYGTGYSDVNPGYMILMSKNDSLLLTVNQKSFVEMTGVTDSEAEVTIAMDEKQRYLRQYEARNMTFSDDRNDYDSDEAFANFREIQMGNIPAGVLYRSASGLDDSHGRAAIVSALYETNGISTIVDLANSEEAAAELLAAAEEKTYSSTLFDDGHVIANGSLGIDMTSDAFRQTLALDLRQMLTADKPFVLECLVGKDRTGVVALILESLMGASYAEMLDDYMLSYINLYHLSPDDERYQAIKDGNADYLFMTLSGTEHVNDMLEADYQAAAERYLTDAGLTEDEITHLKSLLSTAE